MMAQSFSDWIAISFYNGFSDIGAGFSDIQGLGEIKSPTAESLFPLSGIFVAVFIIK